VTHWTERSTDDFIYRIVSDFALQIEDARGGTLTTESLLESVEENKDKDILESIVKLARKSGMKVSLVAYEDNDPDNERGPINSDIFRICWEKCGKPTNYFDLEET
jgi:hypothetical protein